FVDWEDNVLKTETVEHSGAATPPVPPDREGYTFTGWDQVFANVTDNLTVKALYSIHNYKVMFESNGGSAVDEIEVDYGQTISAPDEPEREGYAFAGWYKEDGLTEAWNFDTDTIPANNITLYAKWEANTYL